MALVHHQNAITILHRVAQIVRYHDGCQLLFTHHAAGQLHNDISRFWIQRGGVLIQNQKGNGRHGGHQQRQRLTLTA